VLRQDLDAAQPLPTLERQVNATDLRDDVKIKLQGYISGCYGSLTSFNVLFAEERNQFKDGGGADPSPE
jgi:hypothetical protein